MIPIKEFCDEAYVFFATKQGVVKRTHLSDLHTARKAGVRSSLSMREMSSSACVSPMGRTR